jgi:hypothetical protein
MCGDTLKIIRPIIPRQVLGEVLSMRINPSLATKFGVICIEHNLVLTWDVYSNAVIRVTNVNLRSEGGIKPI